MARVVILFALLTAAAVALLVSQFVGAEEDNDALISGGLATRNRLELSICVDGAGGESISPTRVAAVQRAIDNGLSRELDRFHEPPYPPTGQATSGCPAASVPLGASLTAYEAEEYAARVEVPAEPSGHRVFVYVLPDAIYAATFGSESYIRTTAELLCEEHVCAEVTTGLYVPESVSAEMLEVGLVDALGLISREDPPMDATEAEERRRREVAPSQ